MPVEKKLNGKVLIPNKKNIDIIKTNILIRNQITHQGANVRSIERLQILFNIIENTLWLFDYYAGNEWALNNIDEEFKDSLV